MSWRHSSNPGLDTSPGLKVQNLLARYQAYRSQGLAGIAPYARAGRLYEPANDLREATGAALVMQQYAPEFAAVLAQYPQAAPQGFQESFFLGQLCDGGAA